MRTACLSLFLTTIFSCSSELESVTIQNQEDFSLGSKSIVIDKIEFPEKTGLIPLLLSPDGVPIPQQFDDIDGDGKWDELAFQLDFMALELKQLNYKWISENELPQFEMRTGAYLGYSAQRDGEFVSLTYHERPQGHVAQSTPFLYQFEGPSWESDLVAFRSYFDSRNGKDIFGKTRPGVFADDIGKGEKYHELQDWGMDILKVGKSLGAGALALDYQDSLYRLSQTEKAAFKIVAKGPVRSIIQLAYDNWDVNGENYDLIETITIWAGKRSYESFVDLKGGNHEVRIVTGIVNLKKVSMSEATTKESKVMYTHGVQSENQDALGMGLIVSNNHFLKFGRASDIGDGITNTYTAYLNKAAGGYRYHFYVGWEKENEDFVLKNQFEDSLLKRANEIDATLTIKLNSNE